MEAATLVTTTPTTYEAGMVPAIATALVDVVDAVKFVTTVYVLMGAEASRMTMFPDTVPASVTALKLLQLLAFQNVLER